MGFRSHFTIMASLCASLLFILISLVLSGMAQKTSSLELISSPLVAAYTVTLFIFILLSTISTCCQQTERVKLVLLILLALFITAIVIMGSILIYQGLHAINTAKEIETDTRMEDILSIETKEYKFTVGAGVIGLVGAILYGISKIIESTRKLQQQLSIPLSDDHFTSL